MAELANASVLNTEVPKGHGGSKPSPAAKLILKAHAANLCNELLIRKRKRALFFNGDVFRIGKEAAC